ncbi:MAG: branched-chain amino acid ABC transporter permease [Eubacteriales bacterium]|nr:branched-chain amino acid ABC transporter permease [Clostridiales bacterium]MDD7396179.1 branched-chain amino acid ABC transporter permease [Eubacteriales bacterium]MDY2983249.1 branched-chain amino acid ABC transporter permease [Eubacteriales bacterium]
MEKKRILIPVPWMYLVNAVLFALFLLGGSLLISGGVLSGYYSKVVVKIGIYIILAVSLNVATGYLGQLPLGHAGFMAVGAYASAIFMTRLGLRGQGAFAVAAVLGGLAAALAGFLIGIPALRLKGDYLAIITLGFGEIIRVILTNLDDVLGFSFTGGAGGLLGIPKTTNFLNTFLWVGITCFLIHTLMKSRHGRAIYAIRENEIAAEASGIPVTAYKTFAFVVSAFFAGVAGALYSGYLGILKPDNFKFMTSIEILVMVVLGGMGSMLGSVVSAAVLTALPEALRVFSDWRMIAYALLLILVMIFKPSGLMGQYDFSMKRSLEALLNGDLIHKWKARAQKRRAMQAKKKEGKANG